MRRRLFEVKLAPGFGGVAAMAEGGFLEQFLGAGESEEGGEAEAAAAAAGLDPVAAGFAAQSAQTGTPLPPDVITYFREQARLVHIQTEHLHEQREVQLSHLKLRRFTDRLKAGTQLFIILVASVIGLGVLVMLYDAFASRSVVVDAFKAPSALAGNGITGDVIAEGVLDTLQELQAATRSTEKGLNTRGAWASDIKIEVPETGVSLGEINRLLHERFGHDQHIEGDLIQTKAGGLALTVRGDQVPAKTFSGSSSDLNNLTTSAAEYVYGRSQPTRYADYLIAKARFVDALEFLPAAFARTRVREEQAHLADQWGIAYMDQGQGGPALPKFDLAMELKPNYWEAWQNRVNAIGLSPPDEAAWRASQALLRAAEQVPRGSRPQPRDLEEPATVLWDPPLLLAGDLQDATYNSGEGASADIAGPQVADAYGIMHDFRNAARYMASSDPDDPLTKVEALVLSAYAAFDRADSNAALAPMDAFWKAWRANSKLHYLYADYPCLAGLAYGLSGRIADADAVFKQMGPWSRCIAYQGDVLASRGDVAGAESVWAEGLRINPDPPLVYLHRGQFELGHGDLEAAAADLATATAKAPHYADPLKAWGDLLAKEGQWKAALAKYDEALKYAPAWAELHHARDAAARRV